MQKYQDYTKEPRSAYRFDLWKKATPIETPLGDYVAELLLDFDVMPDESMTTAVDEVAEFLRGEHEQVASILRAHLHRCAEDWGEGVVFDDEPFEGEAILRDASGQQLFHLYGGGRIGVSRWDELQSPIEISVSFEVPYDEEHGLQLEYANGRFQKLNDSEFQIENGQAAQIFFCKSV